MTVPAIMRPSLTDGEGVFVSAPERARFVGSVRGARPERTSTAARPCRP